MSPTTLERTGGTKRASLLTVIGIALIPVTVGGVLLLSLHNTTGRLKSVTAAIVNEDAGVKLNGQTVPLGRELAGELVKGTKNATGPSANYTWVLTKKADAASGLNDGRYTAVVTIPKEFSKAATSYSDPDSARQATIQVSTSDQDRLADSAISTAIATTATTVLSHDLTTGYLSNIYVGFNTLHSSLGKAASGAKKISSGLESTTAGSRQVASGQAQVATGTSALASGLHKLADGSAETTSGTKQLATGASSLATGASKLAGGLKKLAGGAAALPGQTKQLAAGADGVASGVQAIAQLELQNPDMTLAQVDAVLNAKGSSLQQLAGGASGVASGTTALSSGLSSVSSGIAASASGASSLAAGARQVSGGTTKLADGSAQITAGIRSSASGADKLAAGSSSLASGASKLASGSAALAKGQSTLASGLDTAVDKLPTYSAVQRTNLAAAVAQPVVAPDPVGLSDLTRSGLPVLISLLLWMGSFATYLLLRAATRRALTSSRSSVAIAVGGYVPGLVIGALQALALAAISQIALNLEVGAWFALAGVAMVIGASFAAVMQGLTAILGGIGRFLAVVMAALALATSLISTAPDLLVTLASVLPTAPAATAVLHVITGTGGVGGALVSLVVWGLIGLLMTTIAVARSRSVSARHLRVVATT